MRWIVFWRAMAQMSQDEVSCFLRNTYKKDIFRYRGNAFSKICEWVSKYKPDSIEYFKKLLKLIKDDEAKNDKLAQTDVANADGWYMPLSINAKKNIVIFYKKTYRENANLKEIEHYDIYEFYIRNKKTK